MKVSYGFLFRSKLHSFFKTVVKDVVFIYGYLIDSFIFATFNKNQDKNKVDLLVVKLDALGDLFLSIKSIDRIISQKESAIIVVDASYADLFSHCEGVDIVLVNVKSYMFNPLYRYKKISYLCKFYCRESINLNISRPHFVSDSIIRLIRSEKKVGFVSDNVNSSPRADFFYRREYDYLVNADPKGHELEKLSNLLTYLGVGTGNVTGESIIQDIALEPRAIKGGYYAIALGAGVRGRVWDYQNYILIINFLYSEYGLQCVLLGSESEVLVAKKIILRAKGKPIDMSGKSSLREYAGLIMNSMFVVSNESSAVHIAEYYEKLSFCICGGGHYGRFVPYPKEGKSQVIPLVHQMECYGCNWRCKYVSISKDVPPCISKVHPNDLISNMRNVFFHSPVNNLNTIKPAPLERYIK